MPKMNRESLGTTKLPIPPPLEQELIVTKIRESSSRMDELINQATDTITLLQERRTALISAAVTGKIDVRDWVPLPEETT